MATPDPGSPTATKTLTSKLTTVPLTLLKAAALDPLITGPLLLLLTNQRLAHIRAKILRPLDNNVLLQNRAYRLAKAVSVLKWLFGLGLAARVNRILNAWALNNFYFTKQGNPWKFNKPGVGDPTREEIVLVTGGSSGFGYHMVKGFADRARVVVIDVNDLPEELAKLPDVSFYKCDLSSNDEINATAEKIKSEVGNPSVLINNAGIGWNHTILTTTPQNLNKIFQVNLLSHYTLIQAFLPSMLRAKKGHIVTLASIASFTSAPGLVDYCTTKAGALALHEGLGSELLSSSSSSSNSAEYENGECIQTTIVHPFWARTGIIRDFEATLRQRGEYVMEPEVVSKRVVRQVLSGRSAQIVVPDGMGTVAMARGLPNWVFALLRGNRPWRKGRGRRI